MAGNRIKRVLKFLFVDPVVSILGDLLKQSPIMWLFVGWGWLAVLVMMSSFVTDLLL